MPRPPRRRERSCSVVPRRRLSALGQEIADEVKPAQLLPYPIAELLPRQENKS
ncbi:MAG TPA: hypothetical protein VFL94_11415 [Actinomycetales bacterium]|nr:hypothetical protein [Actinomycetales bacterium]